jgi:periplasmic protein TonB
VTNALEVSEHLERELFPEPVAKPALGAIGIHLLLLTGIVLYGFIGGLFHHNLWGSQMSGGSMQVNIVSDAIPLPNNQPLNKNVLSTETPSPAPAPPAPKEQHQVDETAIPIAGKHVKPTQKPEQHKTQLHQPPPTQQNVARFGEQNGTSIPRATQPQTSSNGPVAVSDADFGSRFGWYVDQINRKMSSSWYEQEVDPHTPKGARVYLTFTIGRDGTPSNVRLDRSSGSSTLDRSCERGVQRVDTFGSLPPAYNQSTLNVSYYCEY